MSNFLRDCRYDRRSFIKKSFAITALLNVSNSVFANGFWNKPREIWMSRKIGNDWIQTKSVYWANGDLVVDGYRELCLLLRDTRQNKAVQMDLVLLDVLCGVQGWLSAYDVRVPLIINSGYRTLQTNENLEGAAKNSMHLQGKAADIRIGGVSTDYVAKLGLYLAGGGVGYYPQKGFVHVDTGRLRVWQG